MRAAMRIGVVLLAVGFFGGVLIAQEGGEGKKEEKKEKEEKEEKAEKPEKKKKPTKEERKALEEKVALARYGKKLFDQSSQFSSVGKGCGSCHSAGGEHDLAGVVAEGTEGSASTAIKTCLENRMKADERQMALWNKNPKNIDALIAYLSMLKAPHKK